MRPQQKVIKPAKVNEEYWSNENTINMVIRREYIERLIVIMMMILKISMVMRIMVVRRMTIVKIMTIIVMMKVKR